MPFRHWTAEGRPFFRGEVQGFSSFPFYLIVFSSSSFFLRMTERNSPNGRKGPDIKTNFYDFEC